MMASQTLPSHSLFAPGMMMPHQQSFVFPFTPDKMAAKPAPAPRPASPPQPAAAPAPSMPDMSALVNLVAEQSRALAALAQERAQPQTQQPAYWPQSQAMPPASGLPPASYSPASAHSSAARPSQLPEDPWGQAIQERHADNAAGSQPLAAVPRPPEPSVPALQPEWHAQPAYEPERMAYAPDDALGPDAAMPWMQHVSHEEAAAPLAASSQASEPQMPTANAIAYDKAAAAARNRAHYQSSFSFGSPIEDRPAAAAARRPPPPATEAAMGSGAPMIPAPVPAPASSSSVHGTGASAAELAKLERALAAAEEQQSQHARELRLVKAELERARGEAHATAERARAVQAENEQLAQQLAQRDSECQSLHDQVTDLQRELRNAKAQVVALQGRPKQPPPQREPQPQRRAPEKSGSCQPLAARPAWQLPAAESWPTASAPQPGAQPAVAHGAAWWAQDEEPAAATAARSHATMPPTRPGDAAPLARGGWSVHPNAWPEPQPAAPPSAEPASAFPDAGNDLLAELQAQQAAAAARAKARTQGASGDAAPFATASSEHAIASSSSSLQAELTRVSARVDALRDQLAKAGGSHGRTAAARAQRQGNERELEVLEQRAAQLRRQVRALQL